MTKDSDVKRLIRDRMARTGQNYTAARADLLAGRLETDGPSGLAGPGRQGAPAAETGADAATVSADWTAAEREQELVVSRFVRDGRLVTFPQRRKARAAVLLHLVALFEPGRSYPEPQVNDLLRPFDADVAFWRRELVNYGYLHRDAGIYRLASTPPIRPAHLMQEIPAWEALWLPGHLSPGS
ncbi:MAG: DUF2087 domain-containing protein [Actinobacteria bacterium]|nr:DUF2087 domain-containing protein [Actinomycetota bacterium]